MATRVFHSTPPKPTARGYNLYSAKPVPLAKTRKKQLRENMQGCFLGPMDPSEFMCSFMPANSQNLGSPPDEIDFRQVYEQANERLMYAPFVSRCIISYSHKHAETLNPADFHREQNMHQLRGEVHRGSGGPRGIAQTRHHVFLKKRSNSSP